MGALKLLQALGGAAIVAELARINVPGTPELRARFEAIGEAEGVDPNILHAIAWQESNANPDAVGADGEIGMMQILPSTGQALGFSVPALRDLDNNITAAARLWRDNAGRIGDSVAHGLSAYNAGLNRAGTGPKRRRNGSYVNSRYVVDAYGKYVVVTAASVAPSNLLRSR